MFQTGSQINPALGRVDYTPYMQGAVAGAQSIGQGIASLGQSVGSGIEQFYKKKEQKQQEDQATAFVGNLVKSDDRIAKFLGLQPSETGEYDEKALRAGIKAVGAPAILNLANNFQMIKQEQVREQELRNQQIKTNSALNELISTNYDPNTGKVNVSAVYQGAAKLGVAPEAIAKTLETLAKTNETGAGKTLPFNQQVVSKLISAKTAELGRDLTPAETANIYTQVQANTAAKTNISVDKGANKAEEVIGEAAGNQYQAWQEQADAAQNSKRLYEDVSNLYKEGGYSGVGADAVSFFKGIAASAGINIEDAKTQDQLAAKLATASLERTRALYKGMGALSNLEGAKAEKTFASLSKTPAGNLAILRYEAANAPILEQALELRDQLRDKYQADPRAVEKINKEVRAFVQKNYRKLEDVASSELANANKSAPNNQATSGLEFSDKGKEDAYQTWKAKQLKK